MQESISLQQIGREKLAHGIEKTTGQPAKKKPLPHLFGKQQAGKSDSQSRRCAGKRTHQGEWNRRMSQQ